MNRVSEQPLTGFEQRLLDHLVQLEFRRPRTHGTDGRTAIATVPVRRTRRARPLLVGAWLTALVAFAGVLVISSMQATAAHRTGDTGDAAQPQGQQHPAAFTLTTNGDGTITFTAHDLVDTDAATKALNNAGIAGRVLNASTQPCSGTAGDSHAGAALYMAARGNSSDSVTFSSSYIPNGGGLLIVVNPRIIDPATGQLRPLWVLAFLYDNSPTIPTCFHNL